VNQTPVANTGSASTNQDSPVTVTLSGSDAETCELTFSTVVARSEERRVGKEGKSRGAGGPHTDTAQLVYTPAAGYTGPDSFTSKMKEGTMDYGDGSASVCATEPVNTAPAAITGSASTNQDSPVTVTLSGSDAETCELTFSTVVA